MHWDLQVLTLAVRDVERARDFYTVQLGFRLDTDYYPSPSFRVVQVTAPGSGTSIQFGVGLTDAPPGAARNNYLVVRDIVEAHDQLRAAGISAGQLTHKACADNWQGDIAPGVDSQRRDYASFFDFADPDGNTWRVQEVGAARP